ncbi:MAG TPA: BlaB/IND/MUS family subclass B1 metallo-beta-lactamase [Puia sp.]|nr:BlaB/IND/MUS family subclass B1 metallo-beta-lactamase [Puia sp.]
MKIFAILPIFIFSLAASSSQPPNQKLVISHLTGDFYVYTTFGTYKNEPVPSNSMYMITSEGVVLFDTPWDSTQFQPLLDSIKIKHNKNVVLCISTHFHDDRTAGLEYYRRIGIKTYTTEQTDELSKQRNEKRAEFLMYKDSIFTVGQHTFQTYYGGQGHSPDNIVIWFDKEKILYGGCLVKSTEAEDLGNLSDANVKAWATTIKNIQQKFISPNYIIPGHLDWYSKESLTHTLLLIQQYNEKN